MPSKNSKHLKKVKSKFMEKLVNLVLKEERKRLDFKVNHLPNIIVSFFTTIFALSIVFEIRSITGEFMFYILTSFLTIILVFNEYFKNIELRNYFKRNGKGNVYLLTITFLLSVGLSVIGVYFWVDNSTKMDLVNVKNENNYIDSLNLALKKEVSNVYLKNDIKNNQIYKQEYENLEFNKNQIKFVWKEKDRKPILEKITVIESNIRAIDLELKSNIKIEIEQLNKLNSDKVKAYKFEQEAQNKTNNNHKIITYIIIFLTLLNDFVAIVFAKKVAEKEMMKENFINSKEATDFLKYRKIVKSILMLKKPKSTIHISELVSITNLEFKEASFLMFNILVNSKIAKVTDKSVITISMKLDEGIEAFNDFYENYLNV